MYSILMIFKALTQKQISPFKNASVEKADNKHVIILLLFLNNV